MGMEKFLQTEHIDVVNEPVRWNVVDKEVFRARVTRVFNQVAKMLARSLGPGGGGTVIEKMGEVHITKDGWNILKKVRFTSQIDNTILDMLSTISAQVVIKVGDGSTSSIVAANRIWQQIENSKFKDDKGRNVRPKVLIDTLTRLANEIADEIQTRSTKIDIATEEGLKDIFQLALVSTNGDEFIADIIMQIYKETQNPTIDYVKSKTNKTFFEVIDGYTAPITFLDDAYKNNSENGTCDIQKPMFLLFDHTLRKEDHYDSFIRPALGLATQENRKLVIVAPHYDDSMLHMIRRQAQVEYQAQNSFSTVFGRVSLVNKVFQTQYGDFAIMTGAQVITYDDVDAYRQELEQNVEYAVDIQSYIGKADFTALGNMNTLVRGFANRNETLYEGALVDAKDRYKKAVEMNAELNLPSPETYELKKRISKLSGRMGIIHVGGNSMLEKASNWDLVDDAVRAAEAATLSGYNMGGNLIIPTVIQEVLLDKYEGKWEAEILSILERAFYNVYETVLLNFDPDTADTEDIIDESIHLGKCFDLVEGDYTGNVINPSMTDMEIIRATVSIVALVLTSDQFLSIRGETTVE